MGFWDSLFGNSRQVEADAPAPGRSRRPTEDEYAVDRYRYLLRTAPPEEVERVHAEAFAKLTPAQRKILHDQLTAAVMVEDRPADDEPQTLARSATRAEMRQPGTMEGVLGSPALNGAGGAGGVGMFGGNFASSMFGTIVGYVVASSIMSAFLPVYDGGGSADQAAGDGSADASADAGADVGGSDFGGGFGGGDFGGGDFGDFGF